MQYLLSVIFGLITSLAFEPFAFWPSAFIGLGGWYYLLLAANLRSRLCISYLYGLSLLLTVQHWTGIYVGNTPWIALCVIQSIFFIIPAYFVSKKQRFNQFSFAASYVLVELLLRTVPFTGFGWSRISFTQVDSPLASLYPLGGVVLVAFMSAAISATRTLITGFVLIVTILLSSLLTTPITDLGKVRIALVQGGVSNLGLDFNSTPQEVFKRHLLQTTKSIKADEVGLIVWPENAVDIDVNTIPGIADQITNLSKSLKTPILIGGVTKALTGPQNQSILFNPDKQQVYTKRYLTPFGEYLPIRNLSTKFSKYADEITDFTAGKNDLVFKVNSLNFQTQICYEIINDSFRDQVISDFLIVQTNNATFGDTAQLDQELNIAKVRALETGREVAYVSTTGVTSFIDSEGKVRMSLPKFSPASLIDEVKMVKGQTYTQKYGKYLESLSIIVLLAILLIRKRVRR